MEILLTNKLKNIASEKIYVTKLVHVGASENFSFWGVKDYDSYRAEYILSNGTSYIRYNTYKPRSWEMYKDKNQLDLIKEVHVMTYDEAYAIYGEYLDKDNRRHTGGAYWLNTSRNSNSLWSVTDTGKFDTNYCACLGIRPVVELNDGVYIASGSGTEESPYVLGKD